MTLDKTFQKLKENLYKPFIFYIPKSIVPKGNQHLIVENENTQKFFDNIILIKLDENGAQLKLSTTFKDFCCSLIYNSSTFKN